MSSEKFSHATAGAAIAKLNVATINIHRFMVIVLRTSPELFTCALGCLRTRRAGPACEENEVARQAVCLEAWGRSRTHPLVRIVLHPSP